MTDGAVAVAVGAAVAVGGKTYSWQPTGGDWLA